jgi:hypothetical protein
MTWFKQEDIDKAVKEAVDRVRKEKNDIIDDLRNENGRTAKDFESRERILKNEIQIEIGKAVEKEKQNTQLVEKENAVLKKEVEILEKAFENMGFDVKDMKEILNKLVDGLIAKNEIKLVK